MVNSMDENRSEKEGGHCNNKANTWWAECREKNSTTPQREHQIIKKANEGFSYPINRYLECSCNDDCPCRKYHPGL
jgi:hypothetical protein